MSTETDNSDPPIEAHSGERRRLGSPRARMAAEEILGRWIATPDAAPLDRLVQNELRGRKYLNSSERRWVSDAVFGCVRFFRRQTVTLTAVGSESGARERVDLWADAPPPSDGEIEPEDGSAHRVLREHLSFSDEMATELERALGSDALAAARAFNEGAPTTVRVNTLRATRAAVLARIPGSRPTHFSPWGVVLPGRVNIHDMPGFREGWHEIQEEASQLSALLSDAQPGQVIVDIGAGAGGKSLAMAAMMRRRGRILCADVSQDRLNRLAGRAARAGAGNIERLLLTVDEAGAWQLSEEQQRTVDRFLGQANCVLVDAPCTGSGVLRRAPDLKWRNFDLNEMARLQAQLLEQAAPFVAPDGALLYVTCAFERAQNEDRVEQFLASEPGREFIIAPAAERLQRAWRRESSAEAISADTESRLSGLCEGQYLRTWPHRHKLDAFFAACLVRRS